MNAPLRPFDRSLPMALMRAREAVMQEFRPRLAAHGLTEQQWRVMRALNASNEPMTTRQLSEATFLLGPSLSRITANLTSRQLVSRTANLCDRRSNLLDLTPSGEDLVTRVAVDSEKGYRAIERRCGADRLEQLHALLNHVAAARVLKET